MELISREGNIIKERGLDVINGTPVLDVKPYIPDFDRISEPVVPEWVERLMKGYF